MRPDLPKALSPSDWAAIRAAYESGTETPVEIGSRFSLAPIQIHNRAHYQRWVRPELAKSDREPQSPGSFPPSPPKREARPHQNEGEGRGGGDLAACPLPEVTPTSRGKIDVCEEQTSSRVVLPPQGGGCERPREEPPDAASEVIRPLRPAIKQATKAKRPPPKHQGMIDRLYRVIDSNLSQLEDIMTNQSDPSIADNEKETRTIGTVIGNIEKLKGLENDAGKSRANKSAAPSDNAAATERLGRELAERLTRLAKDLRA
jgi:hypothetical protein